MQHTPTEPIQIAVATKYDRLVKFLRYYHAKDFEMITSYRNSTKIPALIDAERVPFALPNAHKIVIGSVDDSELQTAFSGNTIAYIKTPFDYCDAAFTIVAALERLIQSKIVFTDSGAKVLAQLETVEDGALLTIGDRQFPLHHPKEIELARIMLSQGVTRQTQVCANLGRSHAWFFRRTQLWSKQGIPLQKIYRQGWRFDLSEV